MSDRLNLVQMFTKIIGWYRKPDETILDVGCGSLCDAFHNIYGGKYVGTDIEDSPYKKDIICDAHDLSRFKDGSFDIVTLWSVVEHLYNPYVALREAKRVARKAVIITTDFTEADKNRSPNHYYSWTHKTFSQFLSLFGKHKTWVENDIMCGVIEK